MRFCAPNSALGELLDFQDSRIRTLKTQAFGTGACLSLNPPRTVLIFLFKTTGLKIINSKLNTKNIRRFKKIFLGGRRGVCSGPEPPNPRPEAHENLHKREETFTLYPRPLAAPVTLPRLRLPEVGHGRGREICARRPETGFGAPATECFLCQDGAGRQWPWQHAVLEKRGRFWLPGLPSHFGGPGAEAASARPKKQETRLATARPGAAGAGS